MWLMIRPLIEFSDGDFALSEFGDLIDVIFGMMYLLLLLGLRLMTFVTMCGRAVVIRDAHVHKTGMFA